MAHGRRERKAKKAARRVEGNTAFRWLARLGFAVNGLLHILIGGIAIAIAVGAGSSAPDADQTGALRALAATPGGFIVIWAIAIGLTALGLWQLADAITVPNRDPAQVAFARLREASKAVAYFAVAGTAYVFAFGGRASAANGEQSASRGLIQTPGGVFLVGLVGVIVIVVGGVFVWNGAARRFTQFVDVPKGPLGLVVMVTGVVGFVGKGVALVLVGGFFVLAAFTSDSRLARGMEGALTEVSRLPLGEVLLWFIGIGLIVYGIFCGFRTWLAPMK
jgi:hypothetical protein